jgi:hypothetical protein
MNAGYGGRTLMTHHDEELHRKAVELVREAYDMADKMRKVNLDALNEPRPPTLRYEPPVTGPKSPSGGPEERVLSSKTGREGGI